MPVCNNIQQVLPEEFASVLAGMFEILRERAVSRHASEVADALDETVNEPVEEGVAPDQVQPTPDDNDDGDDRVGNYGINRIPKALSLPPIFSV